MNKKLTGGQVMIATRFVTIEAIKKALKAHEAHTRGAEMDAGFDGGEWSGPAHHRALEGTLDGIAKEFQVEREDLDEAVEMVWAHPVIYVNAYRVSRHYGGPEEGGWYYDAGEPLASVPLKWDAEEGEINTEKRRLTQMLGWERQPIQGRFSVIGGDDFEIFVEDHPARHYPTERPHYE